jgi:RNA polymerase sigma-70 factor
MSPQITDIDSLTRHAAARLLTRATDTHSVNISSFTARLRTSLDKHVLGSCPDATTLEINAFFDALHVDDLCLAMACERGDEAAWVDFVRRYRSTVESAARSACGNAAVAGEITQSLWATLYGLRAGSDGSPSGKMSYYSGCGPLGGWLRAVVCQVAAGWFRQTARLVQPDEVGDRGDFQHGAARAAGDAARGHENPQQEFEDADAARALSVALFGSLRALTPDSRLLLRLHYVEGLLLRQVGQVLGISEATASRRIGRLHKILRRQVEATLRRERNWGSEETAHALAAAVPYLEGQLSKLLEGKPEVAHARGGPATRSPSSLS